MNPICSFGNKLRKGTVDFVYRATDSREIRPFINK